MSHVYNSSSQELRQEEIQFKGSLGYMLRSCVKHRGCCDWLGFGKQV